MLVKKLVNPTLVELLSIKIIKSTWLIFHINKKKKSPDDLVSMSWVLEIMLH